MDRRMIFIGVFALLAICVGVFLDGGNYADCRPYIANAVSLWFVGFAIKN